MNDRLGVYSWGKRMMAAMTVPILSWYLCVLFIVAVVAESAVTVAPGGQAGMWLEMGIWLALSILFAAVAIIFKRFRIPQPKWLLRLFQGFTVLATVVVLLMVVG
jgi:hypothetical protein